ncbi:MAG: glycerate kinase [Gammaproteobacteria bacterium]|nr:glycerate kinase [Gammaproteobacteria bacterium]MCG3142910.1 Glycerate 2-kinase [Gammaproteobacteria bacterium]
MKIVIAPDSFKENLTSMEVATEIEAGLRRVWPKARCVKIPMADGGEGTVQSLVDATGGEFVECMVTAPLGERVKAVYGLLGGGRTAVMEMAAASGLPLVPRDRRNPLLATSYGTGEMLLHALRGGAREIIIGIGGSATNDGGAGMAQALGVRFIDAAGNPITELLGGGMLERVARIDMAGLQPEVRRSTIHVACDVTNPLCGPSGASHVYGKQKGATAEMIETLDRNLAHLAAIVKRDLGIDVVRRPGAGAAGGMGAALIAFTGATLKRGVELVVEATRLEKHMQGATLAITGEGRVDFQTAFGKTPSGVATAARRHGVPVIAIGGGLADDAAGVFAHGIDGLEAATPNAMELDVAIRKSRQYLQDAGERVARLIAIGQRMARKSAADGARKAASKQPKKKAGAPAAKARAKVRPKAQPRTASRASSKTARSRSASAARAARR